MEPKTWSTIRVDLIDRHTCIAELEDEITDPLRREKQSQKPNPFDVKFASSALRSVLEADVKALVEKQARSNREWEAIQTIRHLPKARNDAFTWNSTANDTKRIEPREMISASEKVMQNCGCDELFEVKEEHNTALGSYKPEEDDVLVPGSLE